MSQREQANHAMDLTDEQWQILRKTLPQPSRRGDPRRTTAPAVVNATLHVVRSGCAWRLSQLENDDGIFGWAQRRNLVQRIHDSLHDKIQRQEKRKASRSGAIFDSQTVKTNEVGGERSYDADKEVNGRKRHIVVNTLGQILAVVVRPANVRDYYGALLVFGVLGQFKLWFHRLEVIFADSSYRRNHLPETVRAAFGWVLLIVLRPVPNNGFLVRPTRWIVERTFG